MDFLSAAENGGKFQKASEIQLSTPSIKTKGESQTAQTTAESHTLFSITEKFLLVLAIAEDNIHKSFQERCRRADIVLY